MPKPPPIPLEQLEKKVCEGSFFEFVKRFWDVIIPEDPVFNWHMEVLCDEMQTVAERVFNNEPKAYDLVINVPPGSSKSTICSVMFPAWIWTRKASLSSICGSYSYTLAVELSMKCRDIIRSEKYKRLWPEVELRADANRLDRYRNTEKGFRFTTSTGGTVTGFHGHFLIVDDPINPADAVSDTELKKAHDWINRTLSTRKVDKALTPTILIMQRLHEDDPTAQMIDKASGGKVKVRHINLPAEISEETSKEVRPRSLRRRYTPDPDKEGHALLDAVRMDRKVLEENEANLLEYGYAGQFLQRPVPLTGGMFKIDRLICDTPPGMHEFTELVRFWDKAGTAGGGAFTVGVLMGRCKDNLLWILDVIRIQLDSGEREKLIKLTAKLDGYGVTVGVEQEPGSGGKESAQNTVANLLGYTVVVDRPTGDKVRRAQPFATQVNVGNVRLAKGEWNKPYIGELTLFPNSKYKDQVDSSSGGCSILKFSNTGRAGVW